MSVTYGFYNALNNDRAYDATTMSKIFDGIINDGVFASIGTAFAAVAEVIPSLIVNVGIGRAWFNHTWTLNDAVLPISMPASEVILDRIDAIVLEVDATETVRANSIKCITGTPASSNPQPPEMANTLTLHQHPIAYISRPANSTTITQAQITNKVGTDVCPFVTGILSVISLDTLLGQWEAELNEMISDMDDQYQQQFDDSGEWIADEQALFLAWFQEMQNQLSEDAAGNLQNQINSSSIKSILMNGFPDGTKSFNSDGTVITSVESGANPRTFTKTFTNGFLTMTGILTSSENAEIARIVKTFNTAGTLITTVITMV